MISYAPFYESLKRMGMTEYQLVKKHGISANILHRMRKGEHITTKTLDTLCNVLGCGVEDVLVYYTTARKNPPGTPGDFFVL